MKQLTNCEIIHKNILLIARYFQLILEEFLDCASYLLLYLESIQSTICFQIIREDVVKYIVLRK